MPYQSLVQSWHDFYIVAGTASATLVGLLFSILALCAGARIGFFGGAMEVACTRLGRVICLLPPSVRFVAITFGHVIIGTDEAVLRQARSHEHVHVRQYERWGILFFPLYAGSSLVQFVRGRDPYLDNRFEREACAAVTKSQQA